MFPNLEADIVNGPMWKLICHWVFLHGHNSAYMRVPVNEAVYGYVFSTYISGNEVHTLCTPVNKEKFIFYPCLGNAELRVFWTMPNGILCFFYFRNILNFLKLSDM